MSVSPDRGTFGAVRGPATLELHRELVAGQHLARGWVRTPHLGLGLTLYSQQFARLLPERNVWLPAAFEHAFVSRAREPAQAEVLLSVELLQSLVACSEVRMNDDGVAFAISVDSHVEGIAPALAAARRLLDSIADAITRIPPPAAMRAAAKSWEAFVQSVGGRLERGRMWIHDGSIEGERFELGCLWSKDNAVTGTFVRVHATPPFAADFALEEHTLSPGARDALAVLRSLPGFLARADGLSFTLPDVVANPQTLNDKLELAAKVIGARRAIGARGPFR